MRPQLHPAAARVEFEVLRPVPPGCRHDDTAVRRVVRPTPRCRSCCCGGRRTRRVSEPELLSLEGVLRDQYNYRTERWNIPTVANPSIKLGVQMASFLENARPDHLLIIYYAGHGYAGVDNQLYWARLVSLCPVRPWGSPLSHRAGSLLSVR